MRTERANAKINLFLDVVAKRPNGYHDLYSVMQSISLCDFVSIDYYPGTRTKILLDASGSPEMPTDCRNLAYRAAEALFAKAGRTGEVRIRLEKHIPMAAGLAGGSTDAAAVLRGLNKLMGSPLNREELLELAATLGADVPFCLVGGCAVCEGIGEQMTKASPLFDCALAVACLGEGVSTPEAYGLLDETYQNFASGEAHADPEKLLRALAESRRDAAENAFFNLFESPVAARRSAVAKVKETMIECGAEVAMMSGSGPSVFGIFKTVEEASAATEKLKKMGAAAFVCHPTPAY